MRKTIVYLKEYKAVFPHRNRDNNPSRYRVTRIIGVDGKPKKEIKALCVLDSLSLAQVVHLKTKDVCVRILNNKKRSLA